MMVVGKIADGGCRWHINGLIQVDDLYDALVQFQDTGINQGYFHFSSGRYNFFLSFSFIKNRAIKRN
jgi:hypothetical protein